MFGEFLSFLCILGVIVSENDDLKPSFRVIYGHETQLKNFPHHVRLDVKDNGFICGATIIAKKVIITAAHCAMNSNLIVNVGVETVYKNGTTPEIEKVIIHPGFSTDTFQHDLAVLLLKNDLEFGPMVNKIELETKNGGIPQRAKIIGWGCTSCIWFFPTWLCGVFPPSTKLRVGELTLHQHSGHYFISQSAVKICPGDSGGPLISGKGTLIGVISHLDVIFFRDRPSFFTSVPDHMDWIKSVTGI